MRKKFLGLIFIFTQAFQYSYAQNQELIGGPQGMPPQQGGILKNGPGGGSRPLNANTKAPQSMASSGELEPSALLDFLQSHVHLRRQERQQVLLISQNKWPPLLLITTVKQQPIQQKA